MRASLGPFHHCCCYCRCLCLQDVRRTYALFDHPWPRHPGANPPDYAETVRLLLEGAANPVVPISTTETDSVGTGPTTNAGPLALAVELKILGAVTLLAKAGDCAELQAHLQPLQQGVPAAVTDSSHSGVLHNAVVTEHWCSMACRSLFRNAASTPPPPAASTGDEGIAPAAMGFRVSTAAARRVAVTRSCQGEVWSAVWSHSAALLESLLDNGYRLVLMAHPRIHDYACVADTHTAGASLCTFSGVVTLRVRA